MIFFIGPKQAVKLDKAFWTG
jgi:hypothetical protein